MAWEAACARLAACEVAHVCLNPLTVLLTYLTVLSRRRHLDIPVDQWNGKQRAHVRRHVAEADRFVLHLLLLQLPDSAGDSAGNSAADTAVRCPCAWLDGTPTQLPEDNAALASVQWQTVVRPLSAPSASDSVSHPV